MEYFPVTMNVLKNYQKVKNIYFLALLFISVSVVANEPEKKKNIKIDFYGFLRYYAMFDTHQTINAREGNFMLYPEAPLYDDNNNDVNAASNFNMATIHSLLKFKMAGSDAFNARSGAYLELDFWGSESRKNVDLNHFRLRHAYVTLKWEKTELLLGQYWHPMSVPGFFPKVTSANFGVPFHPTSRNPQIRVQHDIGLLKIIGCVFTQRDFTSTGPDGADSKYLRNAGLPNLHLQLQMGNEPALLSGGAGIDYKTIVPELYTATTDGIVKTGKKNSLSGFSYVGFLKVKTKYFTSTTQGVYAANAYDIILLGGYAEKEVIDRESGEKEFSNIHTLSFWSDLQTTGKRFQFGLFGGYTQNMGTGEYVEGPIYARGADIRSVFRLSSRATYLRYPFEISLEGEHTTAFYGTENGDKKGGVTDTQGIKNFRTLLSVKYNF
jgi:hypothetical protein